MDKRKDGKIHPFKAFYYDARAPIQTPDIKDSPVENHVLVLQALESSTPQEHKTGNVSTHDLSKQNTREFWPEARPETSKTNIKHKVSISFVTC